VICRNVIAWCEFNTAALHILYEHRMVTCVDFASSKLAFTVTCPGVNLHLRRCCFQNTKCLSITLFVAARCCVAIVELAHITGISMQAAKMVLRLEPCDGEHKVTSLERTSKRNVRQTLVSHPGSFCD
jgi:hypothetical protein